MMLNTAHNTSGIPSEKEMQDLSFCFICLVGAAHPFFKVYLLRYHEHAQWQKIKEGKIKVTLSNSTH